VAGLADEQAMLMVEGWDGVSARIRYQVPSGRRAQRRRGA